MAAGGGKHSRRDSGSVGLSLCTTSHPMHASSTHMFGASVSEPTMRPNPRKDLEDKRSAPIIKFESDALRDSKVHQPPTLKLSRRRVVCPISDSSYKLC
jgi:hypothetical protein